MSAIQEQCFFFEPNTEREGERVEFRLVYDGRLPAASQSENRSKEKHAIRKALHPQLRTLWRSPHPTFRRLARTDTDVMNAHIWGDSFARCGYKFVPLVCDCFNMSCSLDILFLRRDMPGGLIQSGGDLDNRIKVLFDALRLPTHVGELAGASPAEDEDPFYVLLEDDRLITQLKVTTDLLLAPPRDSEPQNDVRLIIHVTTFHVNEPTF